MIAGTLIKILNEVKTILPKNASIPKYEVVTVIDDTDKGILVKDIVDSFYLIPSDTLYKIVKIKKIKVPNLSKIYKSLKQSKVTAEYDPFGPQPFAKLGIKINRKPQDKPKVNPASVRILQKIQIICSNIMSSENVLESNKLILAAICTNMAGLQGLSTSQLNKLLTLTNKLIASNTN